MSRVAEICHDLLLVIAPKGVERIGDVVLGGKGVDAMPPELFEAGDAAAHRFLIVAALHDQADMRIAADADMRLLEYIHDLVGMDFIVGCQGSAMAGRHAPL